MQLEISIEKLRKNKLFIATPMYGGLNYGMYMKSCLDLQSVMMQYGIETRFSFIFNESLITRARNYLADEFMRSGYTHLLFLDSDIGFNPQDVVAMMALDKDLVGGPYPKKSLAWWRMKDAVVKQTKLEMPEEMLANTSHITFQSNADLQNIFNRDFQQYLKSSLDPNEFPKLGGDYVFNAVAGTGQFSVTEPTEVMEIGTGYMMVKRHVFEKMELQFPEQKYRPDHVGQAFFDGTRYISAFFDCLIDRKRKLTIVADLGDKKAGDVIEVGGSDRYLSEDYMFCQNWRHMGGKLYLLPWVNTIHNGTFQFVGNMPSIAQHLGRL